MLISLFHCNTNDVSGRSRLTTTYERGWRGAGLANGTARQYKNHASETTQGLFYY